MKQKSKLKRPFKPQLVLAIGRVYLITRYHTGDFRGECYASLELSAQFKVTDPMKSTLQVGDEIEIPFQLAEFLPAIIEQFQKPIQERPEYSREEFERDRFGEAGGPTMTGLFILELTPSQKMALTDALVEHIRCPNSTEQFVDCSSDPAIETTIGELIALVTNAKYIPAPEDIPDTKARTV
jgi:hypothetical protein